MTEPQKEIAVELLQKCLPHLDLSVSEHNDGERLRRDICLFLAGLGYPGEFRVRYGREAKKSPESPSEEQSMIFPALTITLPAAETIPYDYDEN